MNAVIILGGLAAVWFLLQRQSRYATNTGGAVSDANFLIGSQPTGGYAANSTDQQVLSGIQAALKKDPDPTGISQAVLTAGSQITAVFTAHHLAAMKKEASTINNALPAFINDVQAVMSALNSGAVSEKQAVNFLQEAQDNYYTTVSGIIRGGWPYQGSEYPEPTWHDSYQTRSGTYGTSDKNPDSHAPDPCNAACVLGHYMVERTVFGLKKIIKAGGGTVEVESFPNNGAIRGTPSLTISYQRRNAALGRATSGLEGFLMGLGL